MNFLTGLVEYKGIEYPRHKHADYEIITYLSGTGCLHTPEQDFSVRAGNIIIVPPGMLHGTTADSELQSIYICGSFSQSFHFSEPVILMDNDDKEGQLLSKIIYQNRYADEDYTAALCNAYMLFILKHLKIEDNIGIAVQKVIQEITDHYYDSRIDLCSLLCKSGYAEDYIRSHFKKITGKTPNVFLTHVRIQHACYLIDVYKNTLSLAEIAELCGYTDYVYFARKFKSVKGMAPQKYRNKL